MNTIFIGWPKAVQLILWSLHTICAIQQLQVTLPMMKNVEE